MASFAPASVFHPRNESKMNRLPSVSSLMSPPESKPYETFHSSFSPRDPQQNPSLDHHMNNALPPISIDRKRTQSEMDLPSPPVTPYTGTKKRKSSASDPLERDAVGASSRDPVLFPRHESVNEVATDQPLFGPMLPSAAEALVDNHISSHMARLENKVNKPTRDEYRLALSCVSIVSQQYNRNPGAWAREERETLERQLAMMNRPPYESEQKLKKIAPAPSKRPVAPQPRVQRTPRVKRTPRSTPRQRNLDSFDLPPPPSSKPPRAIGTNRDDTDYHSIKDYCPPLDTLGNNAKALKADWKGQMLDLSNDPDRDLLSAAELGLAATLRLSCATYLCSKRRIFEARVKALNVNKEFRKTDAQQACKIDVNKASKLWTAYDRVGWFRPVHFQQYLK
ncbi:SWIRM domain protein [Aspergillus ambiguus]|uniref:SWIRM domain-containing protein n=1 Tax=Aspergillus ambiguus TaxID=176160 RepID=UPI003CCD2798